MKKKSLDLTYLPLPMLMSILLAFSVLTGCSGISGTTGQSPESKNSDSASVAASPGNDSVDPVTISFYMGDGWRSTIIDPSLSDVVMKELTKKTGITFDFTMTKSDDPEAEMNILMASEDLPDYIYKDSGPSRALLISGGYIEPLDDLIAKYGPNVQKNIGFALNNWREEDGKVYGLGNCNWNDPRYAMSLQVNTLYMRYDILKELGFAKLERKNDRDSFITMDEYLALLAQVKEKYPDMIPALMDTGNAFDLLLRSRGSVINGSSIFEEGKARYTLDSKYALESVKFLNKFFNDGFVPKDYAVMKQEQNQNLVATGKVFSSLGLVNGLNEGMGPLSEGNDEKRMVMFYLTNDASIQKVLINSAWVVGGPGNMISAKSKYKERLMKFFDYCASDEGSLLICAGVEGQTYTKDADGKLTPVDEVAKGYAAWDGNMIKKFGIGNWFNTFPVLAGLDKNGNANEINAQETFGKSPWVLYNNHDIQYFAYPAIVSSAGDITKENQPDAFAANSIISAYAVDMMTKAVVASPDQCESEWKAAFDKMQADGLDKLNTAMDENWNKLAKLLGRSPDKLNEVGAFK